MHLNQFKRSSANTGKKERRKFISLEMHLSKVELGETKTLTKLISRDLKIDQSRVHCEDQAESPFF